LKDVFERMEVEAERRRNWPLVEWDGRIVWMQGVDVDAEADLPFEIQVISEPVEDSGDSAAQRTPFGGHS
jgi:hypothetical protein